jgi:hypothetical protein
LAREAVVGVRGGGVFHTLLIIVVANLIAAGSPTVPAKEVAAEAGAEITN